ncbi:MAG: RNA 3'-terminal phosphate cyclase [Haloquadratum sp.]
MIELDGAEGGGQLVRTALSLSALDGRPFRMENVRGNRSTPGLKRQHLACVDLLAAVTDADVSGATLGSETLTFEPKSGPDAAAGGRASGSGGSESTAPDLAVDVGTAGSVTLVADTLLPLAVRLDGPIEAALVGGTDVKWSPPADYLRAVKLPLLRACGLDAAVDVERRGFYPAGGGELAVELRPSSLSRIDLPTRGGATGGPTGAADDATGLAWRARAVASADLDDADVADRLAESAVDDLDERGIAADATARASYVDADSTGAVLTLVAAAGSGETPSDDEAPSQNPRPRAGFAALGEPGVPAEDVAAAAVDGAERWVERTAPIDAHLGDQLVVWLALAGGEVRIPRVTDHVRTNVELVREFGYDVAIEPGDGPEATLVAPESRLG